MDEMKCEGLCGEEMIVRWGGKDNSILSILAKDGGTLDDCSKLLIRKDEAKKIAKFILNDELSSESGE